MGRFFKLSNPPLPANERFIAVTIKDSISSSPLPPHMHTHIRTHKCTNICSETHWTTEVIDGKVFKHVNC